MQTLPSLDGIGPFDLAASRKRRINVSPPITQESLSGRYDLQIAFRTVERGLSEVVSKRINSVVGRRLLSDKGSHLSPDLCGSTVSKFSVQSQEAPSQVAVDVLLFGKPNDELYSADNAGCRGDDATIELKVGRQHIGQGNHSAQSRYEHKEIEQPVPEGEVCLPVLMISDVVEKADFAGFSVRQFFLGSLGRFQSVGSQFFFSWSIFSWRRRSSSSSRRLRSCSSRSRSNSRSRSLSIINGGVEVFGVGHEGTLSIRDLQSVTAVGGCEARASRILARANKITPQQRKSFPCRVSSTREGSQTLPTFTLETVRDGFAVVFLIGVVALGCVALGGSY